RRRRGAATVLVVLLMLTVDVIILGFVLGNSRDQDLTVQRLDTVRAFYAAEGGINMAIREMMVNLDEDGDGTIGSISDDGDGGNDPTLSGATVSVQVGTAGGQITLESLGVAREANRKIVAAVQ
ncbi:MAG: hypothetical protein ACYTGG_08785, partial [Planctomycetota bacterium]